MLQETELEIKRDIETIKETGEQKAQGIETQGELYQVQGNAALTAGIFGAGTTLLTGLSGFMGSLPAGGQFSLDSSSLA